MTAPLIKHKKCEANLRAKCRWEKMSRSAVLAEFPNVVCAKCRPISPRQQLKNVLDFVFGPDTTPEKE